jgi:hypothetical protein
MPIVVNATPGDAAANSYATVAAADAYMETVPAYAGVWAAFTNDQKGARLISGTRAIDRLPVKGAKVDPDQALAFPRDLQDDTAIIPREVVEALFELIIFTHFQVDASTGRGVRDIEEVEIEDVLRVKYAAGVSSRAFVGQEAVVGGSMDAVHALLRDWLDVPSASTFTVTK